MLIVNYQKPFPLVYSLVVQIGLNFSHYPSLVDQFSLTLWSHWALIHILTKLCSVSLGYLDIADILKTSVQYCSDFSEHLKVLRLNRKDSLLLQFSESGFICPDDKGVRQPCEGAFIRVVETDPKKWSSKGKK